MYNILGIKCSEQVFFSSTWLLASSAELTDLLTRLCRGHSLILYPARDASSVCFEPRTNHLDMYVLNHTRENGGECLRRWLVSAGNLYSPSVTRPETTKQHRDPKQVQPTYYVRLLHLC